MNDSTIHTPVIIYGGTGQSIVVRPIIEKLGGQVVAIFDDTSGLESPFGDIPIYCGFDSLVEWKKASGFSEVGFVIAIGNPHGKTRLLLHEKLKNLGFYSFKVIDPSAVIFSDCKIGDGAQIHPGVIIMPGVKIGKECIVNTKVSIDHECVIEDGCEIAPGATLCGCITMRTNSWICAGATVTPRVIIGSNSIVGAGATVLGDVDDDSIYVGTPAKN